MLNISGILQRRAAPIEGRGAVQDACLQQPTRDVT